MRNVSADVEEEPVKESQVDFCRCVRIIVPTLFE